MDIDWSFVGEDIEFKKDEYLSIDEDIDWISTYMYKKSESKIRKLFENVNLFYGDEKKLIEGIYKNKSLVYNQEKIDQMVTRLLWIERYVVDISVQKNGISMLF